MGITEKKENRFLSQIIWFNKKSVFSNIDFLHELKPQRVVRTDNPRYKSGTIYSLKCDRYIQYESGLELNFITILEQMECVKYFYEQPSTITFRIGRKKMKYTPDFAIFLTTGEIVIVEIKDITQMLESKVQKRIEVLIHFCEEKGFGILLTDGKNTIDKVISKDFNKDFEKEILNYIENNSILRKNEFEIIRKRSKATNNDLLKIIIENNLHFNSFPFRLRANNKNYLFRRVFIEKNNDTNFLLSFSSPKKN